MADPDLEGIKNDTNTVAKPSKAATVRIQDFRLRRNPDKNFTGTAHDRVSVEFQGNYLASGIVRTGSRSITLKELYSQLEAEQLGSYNALMTVIQNNVNLIPAKE